MVVKYTFSVDKVSGFESKVYYFLCDPGCSLEGLMLKLKLQYFGHLMQSVDSLEKTLMLGKTEKMTEDEMAGWCHRLNGHGFGWTQVIVMDRESWRATVHGITKSQTRLNV